jgi:hypothetical protein
MTHQDVSRRRDGIARLDAAVFALAILLFVSPWMLDFSGLAIATASAWIGAALIGVAALASMRRFAAWQEWLICVTALALIAAPYALDFAYLNSVPAAFEGIGWFVLVISVANLWWHYRGRRRDEREANRPLEIKKT